MDAFALVVRRSMPLVAAAACGKAPPAAAPARPPAEVSIVTLVAKTVTLARELSGRTSPSLIAEIRPQASGIVKRRPFEEGGAVGFREVSDALALTQTLAAQQSLVASELAAATNRVTLYKALGGGRVETTR